MWNLRSESGVDVPYQVGRFMEEADLDGDGTLDLEEFLALVRKMQHGSPHEGPLAPKVTLGRQTLGTPYSTTCRVQAKIFGAADGGKNRSGNL